VISVGTDALNQYVNQRTEEGAAPVTINREIAALRSITQTRRSLCDCPRFPHLEEDNVRTGFVEVEQFDALAAAASQLWTRAILEIYHTYGWRKKEVITLQVRQVDFGANVTHLDVGTTKNKEGRRVPMKPLQRNRRG
jgi:integrase